MKASYEKINYKIRYAKNIERKMMFSALRRLELEYDTSRYRYVGFGSIPFLDFIIAHRQLGISDMVSIERDANRKARFEFNRPFRCIKIHYDAASVVLPALDWQKRAIVWLDYDKGLKTEFLEDIQTVVHNAQPGSVFAISVNVVPHNPGAVQSAGEIDDKRYQALVEQVGAEWIPASIQGADLAGDGYGQVCYEIIRSKVLDVLQKRNYGSSDPLAFKQMFHFRYADGARMLTMGGLIYNRKKAVKVRQMRFERFHFVRGGDEAFVINVPILTPKEQLLADSMLPAVLKNSNMPTRLKKLDQAGLTVDEVKDYARIYRYYPNFSEAV